MNLIFWLLTGVFAAGAADTLFRSFFTVFLYPSFQFPVVFIIFAAEAALGYYIYKYLLNHYDRRKIAAFAFTVGALYIPVLSVLITEMHTILGLSYAAAIPGSGWTLFPLVIFLPFAVPAGLLMRYAATKGSAMFGATKGSAMFGTTEGSAMSGATEGSAMRGRPCESARKKFLNGSFSARTHLFQKVPKWKFFRPSTLAFGTGNEIDYLRFFSGAIFYFIISLLLLWRWEPIYSALAVALAGLIILAIYSKETLPKVSYYFTGTVVLLVIFSSIPRIFTSSFKNINREEGRLTADYIYTPYGETVLHNKNGHYECSLNHALLFKSPDTELVQETVHMSMLQYPWAEKILVVGGNRTLVEELLRYPNIKNIYWSAIVPGSFDFISVSGIDTKLPPPDIRLRKIKKSDPRDFIRDISGGSIFDVAIVNVPDPVNIFFNRYYSYDFFINLRSIMSDYSIISFDLSAPEEFDGVEKKILFSSVYNSAKEVFPNTLEMEGARIQVLASHTRNFATAYGALSEFLNALESRPEFISPSLIRYKINSKERVLKKLNNPLAPLNTDVRPASLKYSFTQFIFNLGVTPGIFLRYVRRATPLAIYIIFTLLTLFLITLYRGKTLETKLRLQRFSVILLFGIFIYITALARHISTGKIYSQMTVIFLFVTAGIMGGQKFLKNKDHRAYLSYFKGFIMLIGIFFILIPTVFETLFTPMFFAAMVLISASGGFLFGGAFFLVRNIYLDSYRDKAYNFNPEFTAAAVTAAAAVLIIPVTGIIDILPATGILALGCLIVLSIQ